MRTPKKKNADRLKDLLKPAPKESQLKNVKGGVPMPEPDRKLYPQPIPDRKI